MTTSFARELRRLHRTVLMMRTELQAGNVDEGLIADIGAQLEHGIALRPEARHLNELVDALREDLLTPRPELYRDGIRSCDRLMDAISVLVHG